MTEEAGTQDAVPERKDALGLREQYRRHRAERYRQWKAAQDDMDLRVAKIMEIIPRLLAAPIPESIRDWPRTMVVGLMVEYLEGREYRILHVETPRLDEEIAPLLDRIERGEEGTEGLRRLVAEARARVEAATAAERAAIPAHAAKLGNYVSGHMGMPFRPYGRRALDRAMAGHLQALLDNVPPQTLGYEARLGELELRYADGVDARRSIEIPAAPAPGM